MGFKDLQNFNIALLAKLGWRILKSPDDMWVKILRGIYFSNGDFLNAKRGARASWAWMSILEGRKLLQRELCWVVGNGRKINFWKDAWVPGLVNFRLTSLPPSIVLEEISVAECIADRKWDLSLVDSWLRESEVKAIKNIPISRRGHEDNLIWARTKDGDYTVRSGYHVARQSESIKGCASSSIQVSPLLWTSLWNLKVPPKVKHFLWRLCSGSLPSKENLWKRKCSPNPLCPCCNSEIESLEHIILLCDWVKRVWFCSPLSLKVDNCNISRVELWLQWCLNESDLSDYDCALLAMTCWLVWKERCRHVFEETHLDPLATALRASIATQEFWEANGWVFESVGVSEPLDPAIGLWHPPGGTFSRLTQMAHCSRIQVRLGLVLS